jgi:hypothetical protein
MAQILGNHRRGHPHKKPKVSMNWTVHTECLHLHRSRCLVPIVHVQTMQRRCNTTSLHVTIFFLHSIQSIQVFRKLRTVLGF